MRRRGPYRSCPISESLQFQYSLTCSMHNCCITVKHRLSK
jgi:hypothetical protein